MRSTLLGLSLLATAGCFGAMADDEGAVRATKETLNVEIRATDDTAGKLASASTTDFNAGKTDGFFANLGTNGRTCGSCHVDQQGWTFTPAGASQLAANDPLFSPVDGSDCPPTTAGQGPDKSLSTMVTGYGLIRVQIGVPTAADFSLVSATNPFGCAIAPASAGVSGQLFLFRRPLPSTNLDALSTVMWDGRETLQKITTTTSGGNLGPLLFDLADQANGATLGHAQATQSIAGTQAQTDIVSFETTTATAQLQLGGMDLSKTGANGGPRYILTDVLPGFFVGQNDPLAPGFTSTVFTLYSAWEPSPTSGKLNALQQSIGRGERLFNTRTFTIANVAGINSSSTDPRYNSADPLANTPITGTCGTCHNTPNLGHHSTSLPIAIGVTDAPPRDNAGNPIPGILDVAKLPVYTLTNGTGTVTVTDPGRALISGKWVDVGKTKGPILRGLAGRAPYFHNGSAPDLATVVRFYDARFGIGLTAAEQADLVNFLSAL